MATLTLSGVAGAEQRDVGQWDYKSQWAARRRRQGRPGFDRTAVQLGGVDSAGPEQRDVAGVVSGSYSYIDGLGRAKKIDYAADAAGYRITGVSN